MTQNLKQFQTKFISHNGHRVTIIFTKFDFDMTIFLLRLFKCCNFCKSGKTSNNCNNNIDTLQKIFFFFLKRPRHDFRSDFLYSILFFNFYEKMVYLCIFSDLPSDKFIERDSSYNFFV